MRYVPQYSCKAHSPLEMHSLVAFAPHLRTTKAHWFVIKELQVPRHHRPHRVIIVFSMLLLSSSSVPSPAPPSRGLGPSCPQRAQLPRGCLATITAEPTEQKGPVVSARRPVLGSVV